jgi:tetratricopeptide (TPR) repeat protein
VNGVGGIADGLLAADDGVLSAALGQELTRLRASSEPRAALGIAADATAEEVRARFLALAKLYHPNRFARRSTDVVKLANEVFLLLRRAYAKAGERSASSRPGSTPPPSDGDRASTAAATAAVLAARASEISPPSQPKLEVDAALARRRRARSQPAISPVGGPSSSTAPPSTVETLDRRRKRDDERSDRFEAALAELRQGRLPSARAALRTLVAEAPSDRRFRAYLHYVTGRMHESAGRAAEAVVEYDRALGFDPDLEAVRRSREGLTGNASRGGGPNRWFRK